MLATHIRIQELVVAESASTTSSTVAGWAWIRTITPIRVVGSMTLITFVTRAVATPYPRIDSASASGVSTPTTVDGSFADNFFDALTQKRIFSDFSKNSDFWF